MDRNCHLYVKLYDVKLTDHRTLVSLKSISEDREAVQGAEFVCNVCRFALFRPILAGKRANSPQGALCVLDIVLRELLKKGYTFM